MSFNFASKAETKSAQKTPPLRIQTVSTDGKKPENRKKQLVTLNKPISSQNPLEMRKQNESKTPKELALKKISKEPNSPLKTPSNNKVNGIVPIPRVPMSKGNSQPKPSQQPVMALKLQTGNECDKIIRQKS